MKKNIRELITKLGKKMKENNISLVTAESCTGGGLAYLISQIPAVSSILERAYVTYSVRAKHELLNVKYKTIKKYGAVSSETAIEMVNGALKNSGAQISVAITGLAGPDTDKTSNKPIGAIYIACADNKKIEVYRKQFKGDRKKICEQAIEFSLQKLNAFLEKKKNDMRKPK